MVIHKAEKCNISSVSKNKIYDKRVNYNNIGVCIITVLIMFVITITAYSIVNSYARSTETVITNNDTEKYYKIVLRDKYIDDMFIEQVGQYRNSWNSMELYDSHMKRHKIIWKEVE